MMAFIHNVEAQIRRLAGFDLHETVILPENGQKLIGFAAHPSGIAVAMRCHVTAAEYDEAGAVTDAEMCKLLNAAPPQFIHFSAIGALRRGE